MSSNAAYNLDNFEVSHDAKVIQDLEVGNGFKVIYDLKVNNSTQRYNDINDFKANYGSRESYANNSSFKVNDD